jgi:hypothetical protein
MLGRLFVSTTARCCEYFHDPQILAREIHACKGSYHDQPFYKCAQCIHTSLEWVAKQHRSDIIAGDSPQKLLHTEQYRTLCLPCTRIARMRSNGSGCRCLCANKKNCTASSVDTFFRGGAALTWSISEFSKRGRTTSGRD